MTSRDSLIEHCEKALKNNWQYVFGAKGQVLSKDQIVKLQEDGAKIMFMILILKKQVIHVVTAVD